MHDGIYHSGRDSIHIILSYIVSIMNYYSAISKPMLLWIINPISQHDVICIG